MTHNHQHDHQPLAGLIRSSKGNEGKIIRKVVLLGLSANIILMALKLITGLLGHSDALVADGFHSLNDIAADLIILLFIGFAYKRADSKYTYGYGKFETFASFLIGMILVVASVMIFTEGVESIVETLHGKVLERPDIWTVIVAIIAILAKESLYRFTSYMGRKTGSSALKANAWHHRSDAFATVATLIGVASAHFLGEKWRILDPCASLLIAIFILIPAIRIVLPAFRELMESGLPSDMSDKIKKAVMTFPEVKNIKELRGRKNGHFLILDIYVEVDPDMTVLKADTLAQKIKENLLNSLGDNLQITVIPQP